MMIKKRIFQIIFLIIIIVVSLKSYCHDDPSINKKNETNDFYEFSETFINNPFTQFIFSNDYLFMSSIDIFSSEISKRNSKFIDKNEINYPIIPSLKSRNVHGQEIEILKIDDQNAYIKLFKDNTGLLIKYHFWKNKFWILYMIEDESI